MNASYSMSNHCYNCDGKAYAKIEKSEIHADIENWSNILFGYGLGDKSLCLQIVETKLFFRYLVKGKWLFHFQIWFFECDVG